MSNYISMDYNSINRDSDVPDEEETEEEYEERTDREAEERDSYNDE